MQRVQKRCCGNDRGAVLVIMKNRNVHQLAQPLFDDEAVRRLDVFQINATKGRAQIAHGANELIDVAGVDFQINAVHVGKALEENRLAFHHGLRGKRPQIAEPEDGRAIGNDGDHVAFDCVVIGAVRVFGDGTHRHGNARRIGERQIALGGHRFCGNDLELAGLSLRMKTQGLFIAQFTFLSHIGPLAQ